MMTDEQYAEVIKRIDDAVAQIAAIRAVLDGPISTEIRGDQLVLAIRRDQKKRGKPVTV